MEEKIENKIKTTKSGGKYYESLPDGTRQATLDDFYNHHGKLILDKPYLVHSMKDPGRYWANRVKKGFPYVWTDFNDFMESGNIYVFG